MKLCRLAIIIDIERIVVAIDNSISFYFKKLWTIRKYFYWGTILEDFEISQKTQSDAYIKIRKLKEWKGNLIEINKNIIDSNIIEIQNSLETNDSVNEEVNKEVKDIEYISGTAKTINDVCEELSEYPHKHIVSSLSEITV